MSLPEVDRPIMSRPRFDWTLNLGHVLTIATLMLALGTAYTAYQVTINDHDARIRTLEKLSNNLDAKSVEFTGVLYSIKQDLAIIKYQMEQNEKRPAGK